MTFEEYGKICEVYSDYRDRLTKIEEDSPAKAIERWELARKIDALRKVVLDGDLCEEDTGFLVKIEEIKDYLGAIQREEHLPYCKMSHAIQAAYQAQVAQAASVFGRPVTPREMHLYQYLGPPRMSPSPEPF